MSGPTVLQRTAAMVSVTPFGIRMTACQPRSAGVEQGRRKTNQSLLRSTPILDPSLPTDHSPLVAGEMRGQFQAIQNESIRPSARLMNHQAV